MLRNFKIWYIKGYLRKGIYKHRDVCWDSSLKISYTPYVVTKPYGFLLVIGLLEVFL